MAEHWGSHSGMSTERVQRTSLGHHRVASGTVVDARASLAMWLRAGRGQRNMTLDDVARVTKIQGRILERLEAGKFDGLPAEVFVRGFVRSFARCIGLDEDEAIRRYTACTKAEPPPSAKAFVESMSDLCGPISASPGSVTGFRATPIIVEMPAQAPEVVEVVMLPAMGTLVDVPASSAELVVEAITAEASCEIPVATAIALDEQSPIAAIAEGLLTEPTTDKPKKKKGGKKGVARGKRKSLANGTPFEPTPIVVEAAVETAPIAVVAEEAAPIDVVVDVSAAAIEAAPIAEPIVATPVVEDDAPAIGGVWSPKMPVTPTATAPWRMSRGVRATSLVPTVPTIVIDDNDPDSAERELEDRAAAKERAPRARSFLPPILLDREDRAGRQGGLTLAVIILLIAATLTLSYLMRRPSSSGDGVTARDTSTLPVA